MKKKILISLLLLLIISLAGFMLYQTNQAIEAKKRIQQNIQTLPKFAFYTLDSTSYTQANITENQAILLIYSEVSAFFANSKKDINLCYATH